MNKKTQAPIEDSERYLRGAYIIVVVAAALTAGLGLVVLIGWYTRVPVLVQVHPAFVPMQSNTALGFLLCGAGLMALATRDFDLLLSDIILPGGMNGVDIVEEARRINPEIKILLITGYADNEVVLKGEAATGQELLRKPFSKSGLGRTVRSILNEDAA